MYVPGRMEDSAKVMVDIGTGYYVEKVSTAKLKVGEGGGGGGGGGGIGSL